jgi:hypothetical protein
VGTPTINPATTAAIGNNAALTGASGFTGVSLGAAPTQSTGTQFFGQQKDPTLEAILNKALPVRSLLGY